MLVVLHVDVGSMCVNMWLHVQLSVDLKQSSSKQCSQSLNLAGNQDEIRAVPGPHLATVLFEERLPNHLSIFHIQK